MELFLQHLNIKITELSHIFGHFVAVTYIAVLGIDTRNGLVCGLCYNSVSDYAKCSSDLARKRKRKRKRAILRIMKTN